MVAPWLRVQCAMDARRTAHAGWRVLDGARWMVNAGRCTQGGARRTVHVDEDEDEGE